jgi:hypothetical protein
MADPAMLDVEALSDMALFIAIYVGVVGTVFALGDPRKDSEVMARTVAFWMCGITGVLLMVWLVLAMILRIGILVGIEG